uniref:Retrotransposon gag domain-containing protein n=1 Tax=Fagus sylvatica TaxID=28930 RepID=A0A2N9H768_FAGSY
MVSELGIFSQANLLPVSSLKTGSTTFQTQASTSLLEFEGGCWILLSHIEIVGAKSGVPPLLRVHGLFPEIANPPVSAFLGILISELLSTQAAPLDDLIKIVHATKMAGSSLHAPRAARRRRLWRYVTGDIPKPVPGSVTDSDSSDGDSVADVVVQVDDFEARQAAWSFLATRYNCTFDFALEFHIEVKLYQMHQESGQSISNYYSQTASMWEQLAVADPPLQYAEDINLFAKYKDRRRFTQFMMGLREDFEPTRATLLSRSPLPSLDAAVKELIFEENQHPHHHLSSSDVVLATPRPPSSSSDRPCCICTYCQKPGHNITKCYRKKKDDKRKQHQSRGTFPRPQAAAVSSTPTDDPVVTVSQFESMFHQYMSQPSPALSVTSGNKSWPDSACCNHMTPHASHFSQKTPLAPSPIIYTADFTYVCYHIGTISSPNLTIPDTYLVPKLSLNFFLLVNFVNLVLISTFLIVVLMCRIHGQAAWDRS